MSDRVGVRELRQNLSVYLRRVKAGEDLEVTERGHPVALLIPLPEPATALERLILQGRAKAADGRLSDLGPPPADPDADLQGALRDQREERF